jgi:ribose transport system permease protein
LRPQKFGTPAALALVCAGFAILSPDAFATLGNLVNVTQQMSLLAIIALGATFVMVLGEFDLSVSAQASWAGIAMFVLLGNGVAVAPAILATLASCALFGAVSGALVAVWGVPSFIATLSVGTIVGGGTFWASDGATLFGHVPPGFRALARGDVAGIPAPTLWMAGLFAAGAFVLAQTELGRRLYAIGGNREAARLAGVPVRRDVVVAFVLAGTLSGLAGILLAARLGSAHPTGGGGFLLQAYAAVFLGMTAFREGEANVAGTLVGAAIIAVLANGLTILNVPSFFQDMATGAIIVAAVLIRKLAAPSAGG